MTTKTLTPADLAMFTGSEQFYRHSITRNVVYSEGHGTSLKRAALTGCSMRSL